MACDEGPITITNRIRNSGRNSLTRYKRSGELAKAGRHTKNSKNSNAIILAKGCGVCKADKRKCPRKMCIRQHGLLQRKVNYPWVLGCEIPQASEIDKSFVNDGAFDSRWSHVILRNFYCDEEGGKFVRIATLDQQLHLTKQDQLFTFMALKQWLETKANHKLLVLEHALESGKMFGLFSPRITIKIPSMRKLAQV